MSAELSRSAVARSRALAIAYSVHLLIPVLFAADSLYALHLGDAGKVEKTIVAIGAIWVLLGFGALAFCRDRRQFLHRASGPLLALYTVCLGVGLLEVGVRLWIRHFNRTPLFFKPGTRLTIDLRPWRMPGTSPKVTFTVNELGLRGPLPPSQGPVYKIIAVGGSTTECGALDDSQEWPHLLMESMNAGQKQHSTWVGNAGVSGLTTVDHLSCLRRLPIFSRADLLIFLIGVNDLEAELEYGGTTTQEALERRAELFAEHAPPGLTEAGGFFRRSWLYPIVRNTLINRASSLRTMAHLRQQALSQADDRTAGPILPIPDLRLGLDEYGQRIRSLERECLVRKLRCIFLTQPSIWRTDLPQDEEDLLWFGKIGRRGKVLGYASVGDLARAMSAYNQTLLSVCRQDSLECYDLASSIPKDTSAFYDDVHFNIGGARLVAQFLAWHLLSLPPFSGNVH